MNGIYLKCCLGFAAVLISLFSENMIAQGVQNDSENHKLHIGEGCRPQFPGGESALLKYIRDNMIYPAKLKEDSIQGRVIIRFVIAKDGSVSNVTVLRGADPLFDEEALRLVKSLPDFIPCKIKSEDTYYTIPITFKLEQR